MEISVLDHQQRIEALERRVEHLERMLGASKTIATMEAIARERGHTMTFVVSFDAVTLEGKCESCGANWLADVKDPSLDMFRTQSPVLATADHEMSGAVSP